MARYVVVMANNGSSNRYNCSGGKIDLNCVLLNEKLQNELQELK
jgi:hypothetical protein